MGEPDLAGQEASRDADKRSGDYLANEMPVTRDQQHCRSTLLQPERIIKTAGDWRSWTDGRMR